MAYSADKTAYNTAINAAITTQTAPNTIPPEEVGGGMTDLANLLEPYIITSLHDDGRSLGRLCRFLT